LLVLIVGGAIFNRFTVTYVFQYLLVSSVISALLAILVMQKIIKNFRSQIQKKITFSYDILRNFLGFGIVMIPGTLALISMRVLDRYMLTYLSPNGLYDAGIYAIGYRIGVIIQFLVSIVSLVYFPYAMRIADQSNARKSYRKIYNYFIFFGCLLGVIVILFSQEIFRFFIDEAYFEASRIVFVGVISTFLHGVFNILNIGFYIKKIASKIAIAVICGALLNIFLNYLLIPRYGIYGAGVTSILAYIFIVIFSYFKSRKVFKVDYNLSYVLIALMILLCLAFLNFLIPIKFSYFVIKIMFIVILGLVSILLKKQDIIEQYHILKSGK
jgi:O-antigen/teichoic acid export membrane protein